MKIIMGLWDLLTWGEKRVLSAVPEAELPFHLLFFQIYTAPSTTESRRHLLNFDIQTISKISLKYLSSTFAAELKTLVKGLEV